MSNVEPWSKQEERVMSGKYNIAREDHLQELKKRKASAQKKKQAMSEAQQFRNYTQPQRAQEKKQPMIDDLFQKQKPAKKDEEE